MFKPESAVSIFFLVLILFSCGSEDKTVVSDLIPADKYVHNESAQSGGTKQVVLEFVQKIGVFESDDENYMLHRPSDITLDDEGNIYILDAGNYRIQKFDSQGVYIATIGSKGKGPGEFDYPVSLDVDAEGLIYVSDMTNNRITVFSPEGEDLRTVKTGFFVTAFHLLPSGDLLSGGGTSGGFSGGGSAVVSFSETAISGDVDIHFSGDAVGNISIAGGDFNISGTGGDVDGGEGGKEEKEKRLLLNIFDPEGEHIQTFCPPLDYNDMIMNSTGNSVYTAIGPDGAVYVTFTYQNRIEKYLPGEGLQFSADRPLNYEITGPVEDETSKIEMSSGNVMYFSMSMPRFNTVSRGIGVDGSGRIWVMTYKNQKEENSEDEPDLQIEIFDSNGLLLSVLPWEEDFFPATNSFHMFGNQVFFVDSDGMTVYEYAIRE